MLNDLSAGGAERLVLELCRRSGVQSTVATVMGLGPLEGAFRAAGIPLLVGGRRPRAAGVEAMLRIARAAREVDVVHSHLFGGDTWGRVAARWAGRPVVSTEHNVDRDETWERGVRRALAPLSTVTIAVSEAVARSAHGRDIRVIPNGIDLARFGAPWRGGGGVLAVGRRVPQKGFDVLADACRGLPVRVAGGGGYTAPGIEWLGPRDDVPALLAAASVLAVPSRWEGFGLAALEGMAAGVPVVASRVDGLVEVVGEAGLLVPPGDAGALRGAIDRVLSDRALAVELSRRGRERARRFSIDRMVADYEAVWTEVAGVP